MTHFTETNIKKTKTLALAATLLVLTDPALATRLEDAAMRGQSIVVSIGQITALIGIVLGGICLSIGMANFGKMVLVGGLIGAAATFGGPAMVDVLREIFR